MANEPLQIRPASETPPEQIGYLLETARQMLDEEFRIAERLDAKARNQLAAAGAFFAAAQAAAAAVLRSQSLDRMVLVALGLLGAAAIIGLLVALIFTTAAWRLTPEKALPVELLRDNYLPHAAAGNARVGQDLVRYTLDVVEHRRRSNAGRADRLTTATGWCLVALVAAGVELLLAVVAAAAT